MDPITLAIAVGSELVGWAAGRTVHVESPEDIFRKRKLPWLQAERTPSLLDPQEIRRIADEILTYSPAGTSGAMRGAAAQSGASASDPNMPIRKNMARALHKFIGEANMLEAKNRLENLSMGAAALEQTRMQDVGYKAAVGQALAGRAWYENQMQQQRRQNVQRMVGQGLGIAAMLAYSKMNRTKTGEPEGELVPQPEPDSPPDIGPEPGWGGSPYPAAPRPNPITPMAVSPEDIIRKWSEWQIPML